MTKYFLFLIAALSYRSAKSQSIRISKTDECYYAKSKLISAKCDSAYGQVDMFENTIVVSKLKSYVLTRKEYVFDKKEHDSFSNTVHYYSFGLEADYNINNRKLIITQTKRVLDKSKAIQIMPMNVWYYEVRKTIYYGVSL